VLRWIIQFLSVLLLLLTFRGIEAKETVVLFAVEAFDRDNKLIPFEKSTVHLLQYLEKSLDIQWDIRRVPWRRALENTLNGEGLLLGMSFTKERQAKFAFSDTINISRNWLVTRCDAKFHSSILKT